MPGVDVCHITLSTAKQFSEAFIDSTLLLVSVTPSSGLETEQLLNAFNTTCTNLLDSLAPVKVKKI